MDEGEKKGKLGGRGKKGGKFFLKKKGSEESNSGKRQLEKEGRKSKKEGH